MGKTSQGRWSNGNPPEQLIERGLMLELEEGMWLHEASSQAIERSWKTLPRKIEQTE
ncbi:MAG: hypothetical protein Ct9H90mP26_2820 [Methanobacteriota archaeon]|nr:MAG: hypothetical protein Ct9H90mP26_2820 [Euryarchaeota archaeon]